MAVHSDCIDVISVVLAKTIYRLQADPCVQNAGSRSVFSRYRCSYWNNERILHVCVTFHAKLISLQNAKRGRKWNGLGLCDGMAEGAGRADDGDDVGDLCEAYRPASKTHSPFAL